MTDLLNFWIPSIILGLGIAVDVAIATIVQFRQKLTWKEWTLPITLTHILFPAFGYYLFWGFSGSNYFLTLGLGLIGTALILLFLYEALSDWIGHDIAYSVSEHITSTLNRLGLHFSKHWLLILAVSWDALLSGPAKSAVATNWTTTEVLVSFFIAGTVVALIAEAALLVAHWLRKRLVKAHDEYKNINTLVTFDVVGKFIESSVIGGFGVLSAITGFTNGEQGDIYSSILIAALIISPFFLFQRENLLITARLEYQ